jgi:hypothetical protein
MCCSQTSSLSGRGEATLQAVISKLTAELESFKQESAAKSKRARELVEERDKEITVLTEKLASAQRATSSGTSSTPGDGFGLTEKSLLKYAHEQSRRESEVCLTCPPPRPHA